VGGEKSEPTPDYLLLGVHNGYLQVLGERRIESILRDLKTF